MLKNARPSGASGDIETDVCVVGAGPAGIAFAREWIGLPLRVAILESGGYEDDARVQDLSAGPVSSNYHLRDALAHGRHRQFGGTANLWLYRTLPDDGRRAARSLPPEAIDLEPRGDRAGWGLTLESLQPDYERAQRTWSGGPADHTVESWADATTPPIGSRDGMLTTRMVQHGPGDMFRLRYRDDLLGAENVSVHVGCTVVSLEPDHDGTTIQRAIVVRADGSRVLVRAKVFVLAAGGVENVQLLLLSPPTRPGGPGNLHDIVGRYVTDHPEFRMGTITPSGRDVFERLGLYDIRRVDGILVSGALALREDTKRREGLLNVGVGLIPQERGFGSRAHRAIAAFRAVRRGQRPAHPFGDLGAILASPLESAAIVRARGGAFHEFSGGWSGPDVDRTRFETIEVHAATEQTPDRENRILLSDQRDGLGRQRARLEWAWSQRDRENIARSIPLFAEAFGEAGIGRFERWVELDGAARPVDSGIHHPMGGTRMHADPREGVVDPDGLVHGISNLYVAGSSVFPNGHGYANPTLTLLALTIRLADHVKSRFG